MHPGLRQPVVGMMVLARQAEQARLLHRHSDAARWQGEGGRRCDARCQRSRRSDGRRAVAADGAGMLEHRERIAVGVEERAAHHDEVAARADDPSRPVPRRRVRAVPGQTDGRSAPNSWHAGTAHRPDEDIAGGTARNARPLPAHARGSPTGTRHRWQGKADGRGPPTDRRPASRSSPRPHRRTFAPAGSWAGRRCFPASAARAVRRSSGSRSPSSLVSGGVWLDLDHGEGILKQSCGMSARVTKPAMPGAGREKASTISGVE